MTQGAQSGRSVGPGVVKFNYILNHYSPAASTHFAHVVALLREMAAQGCEINLIIEKSQAGGPSIDGVQVQLLRCQMPFLRHLELLIRLGQASFRGYRSTFVRIAAPAAIVASLCHLLLGGRAFLWQSGATHEFDWSRPWSWSKLRWVIGSAFPNYLARSLCQRFVTGPASMVDYYADVVGIAREKIRLLYNDVDLVRWKDAGDLDREEAFRQRFGVKRPAHVLLLVHRLSPVRRTPMYLGPLFSELARTFGRDWILLVAGGGSELPAVMQLATEAGVDGCCRFLGAVPNQDLPALYRLADVFLNPSHVEGFPRVVIEAMACGLPILTTDAGGTRELLGPRQVDWVVDRDAPDLFAERVVSLIADKEEMACLAQENLATVQRFSTPQVARMYAAVLGE